MSRSAAGLLVIALAVGVACAGPPIVANELAQPIEISSSFADGTVRQSVLHPGQRLYLSGYRNHPVRVTISTPDGAVETYSEADTPHLLGSRVRGDVVGWRVTADGIVPLEELDPDI